MSIVPFVLLSALLHGWVGWRLAPALASVHAPAAAWLWFTLLASALLMPLGFMARRLKAAVLTTVLTWAGLLFMGLFSTLFVLTLLRDALLAPALLLSIAANRYRPPARWPCPCSRWP